MLFAFSYNCTPAYLTSTIQRAQENLPFVAIILFFHIGRAQKVGWPFPCLNSFSMTNSRCSAKHWQLFYFQPCRKLFAMRIYGIAIWHLLQYVLCVLIYSACWKSEIYLCWGFVHKKEVYWSMPENKTEANMFTYIWKIYTFTIECYTTNRNSEPYSKMQDITSSEIIKLKLNFGYLRLTI